MLDGSPARRPGPAIEWLAAAVLLGAFAFAVRHYFFFTDDAFISFRYADQWVRGHGPTWNPGERVEGYSTPLWVAAMALGLTLGIPPEISSNVISIACGLAVLVVLYRMWVWHFGRSTPLAYLPLATLTLHRSFAAWCTSGMETMAFTLLVLQSLFGLARERVGDGVRVPSGWWFALGCLMRPEGFLFAGIGGLFVLADVTRGRRSLRAALAWGAPIVALVVPHLLWRRAYYGYWLPNTFYAKVAGAWLDQGAKYLSFFQNDYQLAWFLPLALVPLFRRRTSVPPLLAAAIASYLGYVLYVGGDRFEFRFMIVILPGAYWLVAAGLQEVMQTMQARGRRTPAIAIGAVAAGALLLVTHLGSLNPRARYPRAGVVSVRAIGDYADMRASQGKVLRALIDAGELPADLVVSFGAAGAVPYYTRWPAVDRFGLNDEYVAHLPLARRGLVAHERHAPLAYLRERGASVFAGTVMVTERLDFNAVGQTWDGVKLPARAVRAGGYYFQFGALVPDEALRGVLPGKEIIDLDALYREGA